MSLTDQKFIKIPEMSVPCVGLGTSRSSGTYVALLMQLEGPDDRVEILVDALKMLGIPLEKIAEAYIDEECPGGCGMAKRFCGECETINVENQTGGTASEAKK